MKRLLIFAVLSPAIFGQKREDFIALQRDVASLQEQVRQLQKSQDDKMNALQAMLQQAVDASSKLAGSLTTLQRDVDAKLNDQSAKTVAPIATLGTKVDQMSFDIGAVSTNLSDLSRRVKDLDTKLTDIKSAITLIQTPVTPPPQPGAAQVGGGTTPGIPACPTAEALWNNARSDQSGGKLELAMGEFVQYVKCYEKTENAPAAQFQIGYMYFQNGNYDDAVLALDDVLNKWPENPKTAEALYFKAVSQQKGGHKTDAGKTYKEYLSKYPRGEHVTQAHANLRTLGLEPTSRTNRKRE
jgi:TolA-binding protein